jgi:hypothetical protein
MAVTAARHKRARRRDGQRYRVEVAPVIARRSSPWGRGEETGSARERPVIAWWRGLASLSRYQRRRENELADAVSRATDTPATVPAIAPRTSRQGVHANEVAVRTARMRCAAGDCLVAKC